MHPSPALALAVVLLACSAPRPSPEYEAAAQIWNELVRVDPDRAAEDPRSDEVLQGLGRVPTGSSDAPAASALRTRIESERRALAEERSRREEMSRRAAIPAAPVPSTSPADPGAPGGGDRGVPSRPPIAPGLGAKAFRDAYEACFAPAGEVALTAPNAAARPGELWSLKDDPRCREAHPAMSGQVVVLSEGAVAAVRPAAAIRRFEVRQDAELAKLPDGRPGMVVEGKIVPIPAGARVVRTGPAGSAP